MAYIKLKNGDGTLYDAVYEDCGDYYYVTDTHDVYQAEDVVECDSSGNPLPNSDDRVYSLTPFSCFALALHDANVIDDVFALEGNEKEKLKKAYNILENKFYDNGYFIKDDDDKNPKSTTETPMSIFKKVVMVLYPATYEEQREIAYDLFCYHMKCQGNL